MSKKKKILLLSDDLRMHSGIATQAKEFVMGTLQKYDWVQLGGAVKHPEEGKVIDMSEAVKNDYGIENAYLKIYPVTGYGSQQILREILNIEKPDAILHFTDPRFWIWLYQMENEIRQDIPIMYYNIWDDLPDPLYNTHYYRSSDLLMGISKQTYGINKRILSHYNYEDWQVKYVPHGVNPMEHNVVDKGDTKFREFEGRTGLDQFKFKLLYVNRNIRRKQPGDFILAYAKFLESLTEEQRKECCLIFHTQPVDENGTDLKAVCDRFIPGQNVIFTFDVNKGHFNDEEMNFLYNSADVYMNIASNEGFGLGSLEALMSGTPIIVNVTGGLQDQCGFADEAPGGGAFRYLNADDYVKIGSNHRGEYTSHGCWVKPVFPTNSSLQGSPPTPYIFDDRCSFEDAGDAILYWYKAGPEERKRCGKVGREWVMSDDARMTTKHMSESFIENIETTFEKWKPQPIYTMEVL